MHRTLLFAICLLSTSLWAQNHALCLPPSASHQAFIEQIRPIVQRENARIAKQRQRIKAWRAQWKKTHYISLWQRKTLSSLGQRYRTQFSASDNKAWDQLEKRVDTIPTDLVIAGAILESGYGQSRFATEGCNLFGQQCYTAGCGIVPHNRSTNKHHEVKRFDSIDKSIGAYMQNLNTHRAYQRFRQARADLRTQNQPLSALVLAKTLSSYAEIGVSYTERLSQILKTLHTRTAS